MVIIQEETTGCGIASVANIVGCTYAEVKSKANSMGIFADDKSLYSDTAYIRNLLNKYGVNASKTKVMCQHFSGQTFKFLFVVIRNQLVINNR